MKTVLIVLAVLLGLWVLKRVGVWLCVRFARALGYTVDVDDGPQERKD